MEKAVKILEEIGKDLEEDMLPGKLPQFAFLDCSASSLDLDGYVWFRQMDWFSMRAARGRFNLEVIKRFSEKGIDFAYPTTTVYLADAGQTPNV